MIQSPLEQFAILPLIPIQIGNLYFSFTNSSLYMLLTLSLVLLLVHFVTQKGGGKSVPNAWQSLVELLYDFVPNPVNEQIGGLSGNVQQKFSRSLFFLVAVPFLLGLIQFVILYVLFGCMDLIVNDDGLGTLVIRSLRFFFSRLGCAGSPASAFILLATTFAEASYMLPSSSAPVSAGPQGQPVLEGQPVLGGLLGGQPVLEGQLVLEGRPIPKEQEWEAISSGRYCSSVVHIPFHLGEIKDTSTLSKLSKLNGFLLWIHDKMGSIQPHYTRTIQYELDQVDEDSLPARLDSILRRERERFGLPPE